MQKGRSTKREPADRASCFLRRHYPDQVRGFPGSHPLLSAGHTQLPFFACDYSLPPGESQEPEGLLSLVCPRGETCQCPLFRSRSIADSCSTPLFSCLSKRKLLVSVHFLFARAKRKWTIRESTPGEGISISLPLDPILETTKAGATPAFESPRRFCKTKLFSS